MTPGGVATFAKAITAGITGAAAAAGTALVDGKVDGGELLVIVFAGIGAAAAVYSIPNADDDPGA